MSSILTVGVIQIIFNANNQKKPERPVLQVAKVLQSDHSQQGPQRIKVVFNDGCELAHGVIPTNLVKSVSGYIQKGQILRLAHYNCIIRPNSDPESQKVIIVTNYEMDSDKAYPIFSNLPRPTSYAQLSQKSFSKFSSGNAFGSSYTNNEEFFPISSLSPYYNVWKIEAFVGLKSDIRYWRKDNGVMGKWFNVILFDNSGEIRATAFEQYVDEFYDKFQVGKLYVISKARVNVAKKQYTTIKSDYELILGSGTNIQEVMNKDPYNVIKFKFVKISDLIDYEKDDVVDIIGLVTKVNGILEITSKTTQRNVNKRAITIIDQSKHQITLTLWGIKAEKFDTTLLNHVIACKNVRVGDYQGRNLSAVSDTTLLIDPKIKEAKELHDWYELNGANSEFISLSTSTFTPRYMDDVKTLEQVKHEKLGQGNREVDFLMIVTILNIRKGSISYPACSNCRKKVIEYNGEWHCEKCNQSYPEPDYKYIMTVDVADFTGNTLLKFFNETAIKIMRHDAKELIRLENEERDQYDACFEHACFKPYVIRCRAKNENYQEQSIVRYYAVYVAPIDYAARAKKLYQSITEWEDSFINF